MPSAGAAVCILAEFDSDACIGRGLKSSSGLISSSRNAVDNGSEIDILFLKCCIFTKSLLQYGLDLFNPSS